MKNEVKQDRSFTSVLNSWASCDPMNCIFCIMCLYCSAEFEFNGTGIHVEKRRCSLKYDYVFDTTCPICLHVCDVQNVLTKWQKQYLWSRGDV